jgi:hypothetical protein
MIMPVQAICLVAILLIGSYVFKCYPFRFEIKKSILVSLFLVISLVLARYSVMLNIFGFPDLRLGFAQIPLMLIGITFGPGYGFIGGLLYDIMGLLINPTGFPFLGFTLGNILVCVIPAIWWHKSKTLSTEKVSRLIPIIFICFLGIFLLYIWTYTYSDTFINSIMKITNVHRIFLSIACVIYIFVLNLITNGLSKSKDKDYSLQLPRWAIAVILVELFINLILTPFWLQTMYETPYILHFFARSLKIAIMIPLDITTGIAVIKIIQKMIKGL